MLISNLLNLKYLWVIISTETIKNLPTKEILEFINTINAMFKCGKFYSNWKMGNLLYYSNPDSVMSYTIDGIYKKKK